MTLGGIYELKWANSFPEFMGDVENNKLQVKLQGDTQMIIKVTYEWYT